MKKLLSNIFKKIRAFSVLEIVISFIIIGSITSAFTPVVLKKMGGKSIKISDRIVVKTNCSQDCSLCNQDGRCWVCNKKCGDGYYKVIASCSCRSCKSINSNAKTCSVGDIINTCEQGYYLANNSCIKCEAGNYCPDGVNKKQCEAGYYCEAGAKDHTPCPVGTASNTLGAGSSSYCKACNGGKYQDQTAQTSCKTTTPGHYTPPSGNRSSQENCYTRDAHYSYGNASSCSNCPVGQFAVDADGNWGSSYLGVKCKGCSNLYYCVPGVFPISCSTQFKNCITCSSIENKCTKCKKGYYVAGNGQCELCTKGYYCPDGINWYKCPAGKYSDIDDASECKTCPAGQYATDSSGKFDSSVVAIKCRGCSDTYYCAPGAVPTACSNKISNCIRQKSFPVVLR